jgi:predicted transcriptional regulator
VKGTYNGMVTNLQKRILRMLDGVGGWRSRLDIATALHVTKGGIFREQLEGLVDAGLVERDQGVVDGGQAGYIYQLSVKGERGLYDFEAFTPTWVDQLHGRESS